MNNDYEILDLFPTPVLATQIPLKFAHLADWFIQQPLKENHPNSTYFGERSVNSYILDEPECLELKNYLLQQVKILGDILNYNYETYKLSQSWVSVKSPGQGHRTHSHGNSLISGVFYYGFPTPKTPSITFHKDTHHINCPIFLPKKNRDKPDSIYSGSEFRVKFDPGLLVIFPSYLKHSVPVNDSDQPRYSLAFNSIPEGDWGEEDSLTELKN